MNVEKYSYENIVRNLLEIGVTSLFLTPNIGSMSHPPTHSPARALQVRTQRALWSFLVLGNCPADVGSQSKLGNVK